MSREPIGTRSDEETIPAGDFSTWVEAMVGAIRGDRDADVPCGTCTACCRSSQFIHIEPEETDALAHIPAELLFPAPRLPKGHVLLGYNEKGHCPMLIEGACSIYEHRPRTCRTYDCRVFPAAGVEVEVGDDHAKAEIAERVRKWRFSYPEPEDRARHDAVRAAAVFVREHPVSMPSGSSPTSSTGLAVLAVELHDRFLDRP